MILKKYIINITCIVKILQLSDTLISSESLASLKLSAQESPASRSLWEKHSIRVLNSQYPLLNMKDTVKFA
ncbi:hypothetical protein SDC9_167845 [bioreactor metagenome]|uniref:Uncharacterized protein n=1 Tax=bioreactor metagenome TaxID=1076179 RepID=A0A645G2U5_9ZZZZ